MRVFAKQSLKRNNVEQFTQRQDAADKKLQNNGMNTTFSRLSFHHNWTHDNDVSCKEAFCHNDRHKRKNPRTDVRGFLNCYDETAIANNEKTIRSASLCKPPLRILRYQLFFACSQKAINGGISIVLPSGKVTNPRHVPNT